MKVAIYTLGCKVNQYETNAMIQQFLENGDEIVEYDEYSDVYIINTCTVTNMSDKKSRQIIRRAKQTNPNSIVIAVGCYAQIAKSELLKIQDIDLVLGNNEKSDIVNILKEYIQKKERKQITCDLMQQKVFLNFGNVTYSEKTRAVIKVQDGCDRFCSYCIIPYARGRVRSRKIEDIVEEVRAISKKRNKRDSNYRNTYSILW